MYGTIRIAFASTPTLSIYGRYLLHILHHLWHLPYVWYKLRCSGVLGKHIVSLLACGRRTSISFIYVKYLLSYASWTQMSKALGWISTLEQKPLHCHKSCCMKVCNRCDNVKKKKLPQRRETNTLFPYQSRVDRKPQSSVMSNGMQFFSFIE